MISIKSEVEFIQETKNHTAFRESEMRFGFDEPDDNEEKQVETRRGRSLTPPISNKDIEWIPLDKHPVFTSTAIDVNASRSVKNLLAWDGDFRLYYWDTENQCLHRICIRLGEPEPSSVLAASPSRVSVFLINKK